MVQKWSLKSLDADSSEYFYKMKIKEKHIHIPLKDSIEISDYLELILSEYNYDREAIVHYTFLLEEALIKWREVLPEDTDVCIERKESSRNVCFDISVPGEKTNPFEMTSSSQTDDTSLPLKRMHDLLLSGIGSEFRYRYIKGKNQIHTSFPKEDFKHRLFTRNFILLAIPIVLQAILNSIANYTDAFMLSFLDSESMSAVSLLTEFTIVFTYVMLAVNGASMVLISQLWGKRDRTGISGVTFLVMVTALAFALIFSLVSLFFSHQIIAFFTDVDAIRLKGALYIRILAPSFLFSAVFNVMFGFFRIMNEVKAAMKIGILGCTVNVILNAIFIFGLCGIQPLGIAGAALATLISSAFQCIACIIYNNKKNIVSVKFINDRESRKAITESFVRQLVPIAGQCFMWEAANIILVSTYGHLGADVIAAYSVLTILNVLLCSVKTGIGDAGGVLIGASLGKNRLEEARWQGNRSIKIGTIVCGVLTIVYCACGLGIQLLPLELSETAMHYMNYMIIAFAVNFFFKGVNGIIIEGSLRVGGESKAVFVIDTVFMWGIMVPFALLAMPVFNLSPLIVAIMLKADEVISFPAKYYRYKKYKWLRNLVNNESGK